MKIRTIFIVNEDKIIRNLSFVDTGIIIILGGKEATKNPSKAKSHDLGKTMLKDIIDFVLLKDNVKRFNKVPNYYFIIEFECNNGKFVTIKRTLAENEESLFVKITDNPYLQNEILPTHKDWDKKYKITGKGSEEGLKNAKDLLNQVFNLFFKDKFDYRVFLGYFLRNYPKDYTGEIRLRYGNDSEWKPPLFSLLGYNDDWIVRKYEISNDITNLKNAFKIFGGMHKNKNKEITTLKTNIELKEKEFNDLNEEFKKFNFYKIEEKVNRNLVQELDIAIGEMNKSRYVYTNEIEKINSSLRMAEEDKFDVNEINDLFNEMSIHWNKNLIKDYELLVDFNKSITMERKKYLEIRLKEIKDNVKTIENQLIILNKKREAELKGLIDTDSYKKAFSYQDMINKMHDEITEFKKKLEYYQDYENRLKTLEVTLDDLKVKIRTYKEHEPMQYIAIKNIIINISNILWGNPSILVVSVNDKDNLDISCTPSRPDGLSGKGGNGWEMNVDMMFDVALLEYYADQSFFRFAYHDNAMDNLGNDVQEGYFDYIHNLAETKGLQFILTGLEDKLSAKVLEKYADIKVIKLSKDNPLFQFNF